MTKSMFAMTKRWSERTPSVWSHLILLAGLLAALFLGPLVGLLQIFPGFFEGSEGIVMGLESLAVFIDGAFALTGDVENLAQLDAAPNFGPARLSVSVDRRAVGIGRGLIISLQEEDFGNAVVGEGTVLVEIECFVELHQRTAQVSLLLYRLPAQDGGAQFHVARIGEHTVVRIDRDAARPAEGLNRKRRSCAHYFHPLVFGFSVGIDSQVYRHAKQIEILRDFAGDAESRGTILLDLCFLGKIATQTVGGVLHFELGSAGGIEPLREEPGELLAVVFLGNFAEVVRSRRFSGVLGGKFAHRLVVLILAHHPAPHG